MPWHLLDAIFVASALALNDDASEEEELQLVRHSMAVPFTDRQDGGAWSC